MATVSPTLLSGRPTAAQPAAPTRAGVTWCSVKPGPPRSTCQRLRLAPAGSSSTDRARAIKAATASPAPEMSTATDSPTLLSGHSTLIRLLAAMPAAATWCSVRLGPPRSICQRWRRASADLSSTDNARAIWPATAWRVPGISTAMGSLISLSGSGTAPLFRPAMRGGAMLCSVRPGPPRSIYRRLRRALAASSSMDSAQAIWQAIAWRAPGTSTATGWATLLSGRRTATRPPAAVRGEAMSYSAPPTAPSTRRTWTNWAPAALTR